MSKEGQLKIPNLNDEPGQGTNIHLYEADSLSQLKCIAVKILLQQNQVKAMFFFALVVSKQNNH